MEVKKKRDIRLDVIRIFACFCVVGVHFFLNSGFYQVVVSGKSMFLMCIFRSLFIISVTLFITLTGYLMNKKEISKKYYKGIIRVIIIYLICSVIYHIFTSLYYDIPFSLINLLKDILSFDGTNYSWYIEMYIGLFLIIPFLNLVFNNLKNQKETNILMATLIFMIGIPAVLNGFKFGTDNYIKLIPSWWSSMYPIFYYYLGAYLSKYRININKTLNNILIIVFLIFDGSFNYYRFYGGTYSFMGWNGYSSILVMFTTLLIFNRLLNIKIKSNNEKVVKFLTKVSDATLGAYLISCIFDIIFYNILANYVPNIMNRFIYAPLIVIMVFICSIILSLIINFFYNWLKSVNKKNLLKEV